MSTRTTPTPPRLLAQVTYRAKAWQRSVPKLGGRPLVRHVGRSWRVEHPAVWEVKHTSLAGDQTSITCACIGELVVLVEVEEGCEVEWGEARVTIVHNPERSEEPGALVPLFTDNAADPWSGPLVRSQALPAAYTQGGSEYVRAFRERERVRALRQALGPGPEVVGEPGAVDSPGAPTLNALRSAALGNYEEFDEVPDPRRESTISGLEQLEKELQARRRRLSQESASMPTADYVRREVGLTQALRLTRSLLRQQRAARAGRTFATDATTTVRLPEEPQGSGGFVPGDYLRQLYGTLQATPEEAERIAREAQEPTTPPRVEVVYRGVGGRVAAMYRSDGTLVNVPPEEPPEEEESTRAVPTDAEVDARLAAQSERAQARAEEELLDDQLREYEAYLIQRVEEYRAKLAHFEHRLASVRAALTRSNAPLLPVDLPEERTRRPRRKAPEPGE